MRALLFLALFQVGCWLSAAATTPRPAPKQAAASGPAPRPDYVEVKDVGHYKVHPERLAWREAQAACAAEGAHLVVLNNKREAAGVAGVLAKHPSAATALSGELHAGFMRPDYFVTVFQAPLSTVGYQKWAPEQQHTQICGSINHNALLFDAKCTDKRSFVCEHKKDTSPLKLDEPPITLPDTPIKPKKYEATLLKLSPDTSADKYVGLVQQGKLHYYKVVKEPMRWSEAEKYCSREDGHLLIINHQFEADTLKDHLKKLKISGLSDTLFVGLRNGENKFVTLFGKTPVGAGYATWESEQPDDETCLGVDHNMLLKKVPCWEMKHFICEKTLL